MLRATQFNCSLYTDYVIVVNSKITMHIMYIHSHKNKYTKNLSLLITSQLEQLYKASIWNTTTSASHMNHSCYCYLWLLHH